MVLDATSPVIVLSSKTKIPLQVEVVKSDGKASTYSVEIPMGSSLLEALTLLQGNQAGFTYVWKQNMHANDNTLQTY